MIHRRTVQRATTAPAFEDFHDWVLSLPWVVERPSRLAPPVVRSFAVDCEPLNRRQLWLITGLQEPSCADEISVAVIVPIEAAELIENSGWGERLAPMPAGHLLVTASSAALDRRQDIEALILTAYSCAIGK
jgi:hypothetical protein